jgi:P-type E1-E2 ATPase
MWLGALDDLMLKILMAAAIIQGLISAVFEHGEDQIIAFIESGAILLAVLIVSGVAAWNDYKKEEQFIALTEFSDKLNLISVIRKGEEKEINIENLLVGDIVKIVAGMSIPVDGILIKGSGVATDESAMTGESEEMIKDSLKGCLKKHKEVLEDEKITQKMDRTSHSIPSPILLSGT